MLSYYEMNIDKERQGLDYFALIGFALFFRFCFYVVLKIKVFLKSDRVLLGK